MRRAFRLVWYAVFGIFIVLLLGSVVPRPLWPQARSVSEASHRILVLSNPIHTDIAIPLDDAIRRDFGFLRDAGLPLDAPGARYLVIGWGGRDFYLQTPTWSELKLAPLLKGITLDRSVMHVEVTGEIRQDAPNVSAHDLDRNAFARVSDFALGTFVASASGPVAIAGKGFGANDAFFEANDHFTALAGCNTWTAAALRAGGLRTGWWNPLPMLFVWSLNLHN